MPTRIVHIQSAADLEKTAGGVFAALSIQDSDERDSENYPGGTYYRGELGDIQIKVAGESDDGWEDYQYWVVVSTPASSDILIDDVVPAMTMELLRAGFVVAREVGFTENTIEREVYSLDGSGGLQSRRETRELS